MFKSRYIIWISIFRFWHICIAHTLVVWLVKEFFHFCTHTSYDSGFCVWKWTKRDIFNIINGVSKLYHMNYDAKIVEFYGFAIKKPKLWLSDEKKIDLIFAIFNFRLYFNQSIKFLQWHIFIKYILKFDILRPGEVIWVPYMGV